jgi:cytochrome c-type biogenesis protein CcmH/NrfF
MRLCRPPRRPPILALAALLVAAPAAMASARPSLPAIEPQLMCVTCKIPLNVADSAEATEERELIRQLIAQGKDEVQIKQEMVTQYGPAVLSTPSTKGFQLTAYLVPLAVVLALLAVALTLLPRWRRAARARAQTREPAPSLTPAQTQRLEQDMKRFE